MNEPLNPSPRDEVLDRWINAHLDGRLSAEQRVEFEQALSKSAPLRRRLESYTSIDESLRRLYAPPAMNGVLAKAKGLPEVRLTHGPRRPWRYAVAAMILLAAGAGLWHWFAPESNSVDTRLAYSAEKQPMEAIYVDEMKRGFTPAWVCDSEPQFAMTTFSRFGEGVLLKPAPDTKALGWTYCTSMSGDTAMLLVKARDKPVIVFVDKLSRDDHQKLSAQSGLHLYRRQLGQLVFYEVSPLSNAAVIDLFYHKDIPEEWKNRGYQPPCVRPGK